MKDYGKYTKRLMFWFLIGAIFVFFLCLGLLLYFALTDKQGFNSYTSVSALILSFVSCILSAFFSLATYRNGIITKETSESNRINSYIIENYSLINFCTELTVVKENENSHGKAVLGKIFDSDNAKTSVSTNVCFLVSQYINKPIYRVLFREIEFIAKNKRFLSNTGIDGKYQENTLNRDYNCLGINLPLNIDETKGLFQEDAEIKIILEITSIFNVRSIVYYEIKVGPLKNISENPDTEKYDQLQTYLIHHSIYRVEEQNVIDK